MTCTPVKTSRHGVNEQFVDDSNDGSVSIVLHDEKKKKNRAMVTLLTGGKLFISRRESAWTHGQKAVWMIKIKTLNVLQRRVRERRRDKTIFTKKKKRRRKFCFAFVGVSVGFIDCLVLHLLVVNVVGQNVRRHCCDTRAWSVHRAFDNPDFCHQVVHESSSLIELVSRPYSNDYPRRKSLVRVRMTLVEKTNFSDCI